MRQPDPGPRRGVSARQHPAVRRSSTRRRTPDARHRGDDSRRTTRRRAGAKPTMNGLRRATTSRRAAHATQGDRADARRVRAASWAASRPDMLPVFSTLAPQVRRLRRLALRRAVADLLQPLVLPRLDLARLRHQRRRRRLRKWFDPPSDDPDRSSIGSRTPGSSWRVYFDDRQLVSLTGVHPRAGARAVLEDRELPHDDAVLRGRRRRARCPPTPSSNRGCIYDHNDMHPPGGPLRRSDVDGDESSTGGAISDVRAGELLAAPCLLRHPRRATSARDRTRSTPCCSSPSTSTAAPTTTSRRRTGRSARRQRARRDGLRLRPTRRARAGHRDLGVHRAQHDHPRRDAPRRRDQHAHQQHGLKHLTDRDTGAHDHRERRQPLTTPRQPRTLADDLPAVHAAEPGGDVVRIPGDRGPPLSPPGVRARRAAAWRGTASPASRSRAPTARPTTCCRPYGRRAVRRRRRVESIAVPPIERTPTETHVRNQRRAGRAPGESRPHRPQPRRDRRA